jgi:hypothetical protein
MTGSRFFRLTLMSLFIGMSSQVWAEDQSGGCGLGWKIAPRTSLISSTTRSYVNLTFSNTFGMTSGTSGCARHSIVKNEMKEVHYAEANYGQLMTEMAEGDGEHLRGFAATLGCNPSGVSAFGKAAQENYSRIFPTSSGAPAEMLQGVHTLIQEDPSLRNQCGLTG